MATATSTIAPKTTGAATPHRVTADEYRRMAEAGVFADDLRLELWDGVLLEKMAKTRYHVTSHGMANSLLVRAIPPGWHLVPEAPVDLGGSSIPLPDLAIFRGTPFDYLDRDPVGAETGLAIEVAYTSRARDLGPRADVFAAGGVANYWVLDVAGLVLVTHADPQEIDGQVRYTRIERLTPGAEVTLELPGEAPIRLAVADLFPRREH